MSEPGSPEPVFVTGGTGFVGGAVVAELVHRGREVRALTRTAAAVQLLPHEVTAVRGDVLATQALVAGMRGCRSVFHLAGVTAMCQRDPSVMFRTNVTGTERVVRAAATANVPRVIVTSSAATIGERYGMIADETTQHRGSFLSAYERSKYLAESRAIELGEQLGIDVIVVNPASVQGPGRSDGSARLLLDLMNDRLPMVVQTWLSIVDIADCATGHLLAEEFGRPGQRYLLSGATMSTRAAITMLRSVWGAPRRVRFAPRSLAQIAGFVGGPVARLRRGDTDVCPEVVRTLLHGHRYDGSRATRELGLRYTPVEETLIRTLRWHATRGAAPGPSLGWTTGGGDAGDTGT